MHFWGLTVDTVTTIQLILAIGLSVDYSAHIGHGFMASRRGNRAGKFSLCNSYLNFRQLKRLNTCPANLYLFKVNNRNRKNCEICSKSTIKTPKRRQ